MCGRTGEQRASSPIWTRRSVGQTRAPLPPRLAPPPPLALALAPLPLPVAPCPRGETGRGRVCVWWATLVAVGRALVCAAWSCSFRLGRIEFLLLSSWLATVSHSIGLLIELSLEFFVSL